LHSATVVQMLLRIFQWEQREHPPYSSDLSPCHFHVFDQMRNDRTGKNFCTDDE
ncbi:hypothetical protein WH47_01685, partial [Habropoda laboriosa]